MNANPDKNKRQCSAHALQSLRQYYTIIGGKVKLGEKSTHSLQSDLEWSATSLERDQRSWFVKQILYGSRTHGIICGKERTMQKVIKTACPHDCPDTCSMLATVEEGRLLRV